MLKRNEKEPYEKQENVMSDSSGCMWQMYLSLIITTPMHACYNQNQKQIHKNTKKVFKTNETICMRGRTDAKKMSNVINPLHMFKLCVQGPPHTLCQHRIFTYTIYRMVWVWIHARCNWMKHHTKRNSIRNDVEVGFTHFMNVVSREKAIATKQMMPDRKWRWK